MNSDQLIVAIFGILIAFGFYFTPTIVAKLRGHKNTVAILLLNTFLGWTFIGWVGALVWSSLKKGN